MLMVLICMCSSEYRSKSKYEWFVILNVNAEHLRTIIIHILIQHVHHTTVLIDSVHLYSTGRIHSTVIRNTVQINSYKNP